MAETIQLTGDLRRNPTRAVQVGDVTIGGGNPIVVQSMAATRTQDIEATVRQVKLLEAAGADLVRVAPRLLGRLAQAPDTVRTAARERIVENFSVDRLVVRTEDALVSLGPQADSRCMVANIWTGHTDPPCLHPLDPSKHTDLPGKNP